MNNAWTPERVEFAQLHWRAGWSATQIAKALGGVTRNAVIGKLHRLKELKRAQPTKGRANPKRLKAMPSAPRVIGAPDPIGGPVGAPGRCCWIQGQPGSPTCGHPEYKRSYCEHHFFVAYQAGTRQVGGDLAGWVRRREWGGIKRGIPQI